MTDTEPVCDKEGCICRWARAQTDEVLAIAYACVTRVVFDRAGVNVPALTDSTSRTMDVEQVEAMAKLQRWAGVADKSS